MNFVEYCGGRRQEYSGDSGEWGKQGHEGTTDGLTDSLLALLDLYN